MLQTTSTLVRIRYELEGTYFSGLFCYGCMLMLLLVLWKIMGCSESCNQLAGFLFILSPGLLTYITADPMAIIISLPASQSTCYCGFSAVISHY